MLVDLQGQRRRIDPLVPAITAALIVLTVVACPRIHADPIEQPSATTTSPVVVATVGQRPIYLHEVERVWKAAVRDRPVAEEAVPIARAAALAQLIDRQLVLQYLRQSKNGAAPQEVQAAIDGLVIRLKQQGHTFQAYLQEAGLTEQGYRDQLEWELGWSKLLAKVMTESRLQNYFNTHRQDFDGRLLTVRHILLPATDNADPSQWEELIEQARALREQITHGEPSFEEAAAKYSAGPSKERGGLLGDLPRHGEMPEAFSAAAFASQPGEISQPIRTPFGVHLIRVDAVHPGTKQWSDVRHELEKAFARYAFRILAERQRSTAKITFSGVIPYFQPGTERLVTKP